MKSQMSSYSPPSLMRLFKVLAFLFLAVSTPRWALANLAGPYTPDANTLFLFHFNEDDSSSIVANEGSVGGYIYSVSEASATTTPSVVTGMLGAIGYSDATVDFGNCMTNPATGYVFGYDGNNDGSYEGDTASTRSTDAISMSTFNIGNGGQSPFTLEALIQPSAITGSQEIIATDSSAATASRGFQFVVSSSTLKFQFIGGSAPRALSGAIPTEGDDAFVAGTWYHVAVTYDGATLKLYWTKMDSTVGAAHLLNSGAMTLGANDGLVTGPLTIGNENRNTAGERFLGSIDEVRISSVARAANEMQFYSPVVTITQNPVSQNVDYNQQVTFSVGASSLTEMGYQWRFNSNNIAGATDASYTITNVAASDGGYYDVIVTNTGNYTATSTPALLVVGAANFLAHRYSFTTDTSDSVGDAWGTNFGNAMITDGQLVLDGTSGTYMELPGNLFNGSSATALSVEFWATFGTSDSNAKVFEFGAVNANGNGINNLGFSPKNASGLQQLSLSAGDLEFQQVATSSPALDGLSMHVACVIDPPNQTIAIFTNGCLESINTNMTVSIASLNDTFSYIGRSLFTTYPYLNASIDEFRIYNGALADLSVKQSEDQGPDAILQDGPVKFATQPAATTAAPLGFTITLNAAAVGYLPISYQWYKNGVEIDGATNATYPYTVVDSDNGATMYCRAQNTIGVTTYTTNSTTTVIKVVTPSSLTWYGSADGNWNTSSLNWENAANNTTAFSAYDNVTFNDEGIAQPIAYLTEQLNPISVTVSSTSDYTFTGTGSLTGQGTLLKQNTGKLVIDVANKMTGTTLISGGTLQIGNDDNYGTLAYGPLTNNATLSFRRADTAFNMTNSIHGSGKVSYDGYGTITVSGASDYTGATLINQGIVNLQNTSGLGAQNSKTTVAAGGQLYITANVDVSNSVSLNAEGDSNGALRKGGAGKSVVQGTVNLASDTTIGVDGSSELVLSNTVSGSGTLTKMGTGTLTLGGTNTFTAGAVLSEGILKIAADGALGKGAASINIGAASRFVLADGVSVANAFSIPTVQPGTGLGVFMPANSNNTNGTITTLSGAITFGDTAANGGHFYGASPTGYLLVSGSVTMPDGPALLVRAGNVRFSGNGSYSELQIRTDTTSIGADNAISTNAVLDIGGNGKAWLDLNGYNQRITGLKNEVTPGNVGWVTNGSATSGTLTLDLGDGNSRSFAGGTGGNFTFALNSGIQNFVTNGASGSGYLAHTGNTLVNGGTFYLGMGVVLPNTPVINIAQNAILDATEDGLALTAQQVLQGSGTVNGNVTGGGVAPGTSIGTLTINGDVVLDGITTIQVNKAAGTKDQLVVSGSLTYGGTLYATNLGGDLNVGDSFTIVSAGSSSGNFTSVVGYIAPGKAWSFSNGVLSVIEGSSVNTDPTSLTSKFIGGNSLVLSWPSDHIGWHLQVQKTTLDKGLGTNWVDVPNTTTINSITNAIDLSNGAVFYRIVYP